MQSISIVPIGGIREFGTNCLIIINNKTLTGVCIDLGVKFNRNQAIGDTKFINPNIFEKISHSVNINRILITHSHEDHIGSLKIFEKFIEKDIFKDTFRISSSNINIEIIGKYKINKEFMQKHTEIINENQWIKSDGDINYMFIPIDHSIPSSFFILLEINDFLILHTGDWKIDLNSSRFQNAIKIINAERISKSKKLIILSDSTNSDLENKNPLLSEDKRKEALKNQIIENFNNGKQSFITFFSTSVSVMKSCLEIAYELGYNVSIIGRTIKFFLKIAIKHNIIDKKYSELVCENITLIKEEDKTKNLVLVSGSQGEKDSGLQKLINNKITNLKLNNKSAIIYSARVIPNNIENFQEVKGKIIEREALFLSKDDFHISGHAYKEMISLLYESCKPDLVIPLHGSLWHMKNNESIANKLGIKTYSFKNHIKVTLNIKKEKISLTESKFLKSNKVFIINDHLVEENDHIVNERMMISKKGIVNIIINNDRNISIEEIGTKINDKQKSLIINVAKNAYDRRSFIEKIKLHLNHLPVLKIYFSK